MPDSDASIIDTVKRAIDDDDDQQLETLLEQLTKRPGRMDLVIDKLFEGFHGHSCLHRFHTSTMIPRKTLIWVLASLPKKLSLTCNFFAAGCVNVERLNAAPNCWFVHFLVLELLLPAVQHITPKIAAAVN